VGHGAIEQARGAITEGRDAIQWLRSSASLTNDLAQAIGKAGEELAADPNTPEFDLQVVGTSRELVPIVRDEIYRISCEAVRNAFHHAGARRIEVEIQYDSRRLRLRVRDDGKGIDPEVLSAGRRAGHHGLPGMHERARLAGGKLTVWSELDSGAEIELTIPASVAYAKSRQRSMVSGEGT
jgi:signal transduction histidine kinase